MGGASFTRKKRKGGGPGGVILKKGNDFSLKRKGLIILTKRGSVGKRGENAEIISGGGMEKAYVDQIKAVSREHPLSPGNGF